MASLPTLFPNSQITAGGWSGPGVDQTDIHLYIDEPAAGDGAEIFGSLDASTTACELGLTDMPSDFATMNSLSLEIRHARGATAAGENGGGDDTHSLHVMILDSAGTQLTDEMTIESGTVAYLAKTEVVAFTGVHQTANKATWDGAKISIRTVVSKNMGGDGDRTWIEFVRLINGDYDSAGETASGGSTSTVTATSEGAGVKDTDGGTTSTVTTVGSGAGTKKVSGSSDSTVTVVATGAGPKGGLGGATPTVTIVATGAGVKKVSTGTDGTVTVVAEGAGQKDVSGDATATVTVVATGAGQSSEGGGATGGSTSTVTIVATGAGVKVIENGTTSSVTVSATGQGTKEASGEATSTVTIVATGAGQLSSVEGGATATVTVVATGGGQSSEEEVSITVEWGAVRSPRTWTRGTRGYR